MLIILINQSRKNFKVDKHESFGHAVMTNKQDYFNRHYNEDICLK